MSFQSPKHEIVENAGVGTHTWTCIIHTPKTGHYMIIYHSLKLLEVYYQVAAGCDDSDYTCQGSLIMHAYKRV